MGRGSLGHWLGLRSVIVWGFGRSLGGILSIISWEVGRMLCRGLVGQCGHCVEVRSIIVWGVGWSLDGRVRVEGLGFRV